jgi:S-DNA-T family DNA segregation ATPase FtsK/SpoIIIE
VLLAALAALSLTSLATFERPLPFAAPWSAPNACGPLGAALAFAVAWAFGRVLAFALPVLLFAWAWNRWRDRPTLPLGLKTLVSMLLVVELDVVAGLARLPGPWASASGDAGALALHSALGPVGSWIVIGALLLVTLLWASELGFHWVERVVAAVARGALKAPLAAWASLRGAREQGAGPAAAKRARAEVAKAEKPEKAPVVRVAAAPAAAGPLPVIAPARVAPEPREEEQMSLPFKERRSATALADGQARPALRPRPAVAPELPALSLLEMPAQQEDLITATDLTDEARLLTTKLADFDIEGRVTEIHPGPVVTTFEFEPAAGVKVNQIVSREDDLALALRAQRIRILAPIPGKGTVGVEIPNRRRRTVYLREVLGSAQFAEHRGRLKVALGVDVVGQPFVSDLTQMPHVLVAGATGSGKSVCLNSIIIGLLFQHGPETLRLVMVDPKMLELSGYNGIPHLVMPVVTEAKRAARALRWAVSEMEKRYKLLATCGARNIEAYNEKARAGLAPTAPGSEAPAERLAYCVVIIDELADLMLTVPAEIEEPIARLAQMARAVGIHMVLATQRPSVDVITGVIKANFPSRIAFQVASKIDSRTVLDMNGAENLLGHGDMLFTPAGKPEPYRVHGAYVSEEETARVVRFWAERATEPETALATQPALRVAGDDEDGVEEGEDFDDDLLREAARLVVSHQQGSTSLLQRRLKVGYARAGRLMDQLETMGVVGPFQGSKARDVLVDQRWLAEHDIE